MPNWGTKNTWRWWVQGRFLVLIQAGTKPLEARPRKGEFAQARVDDVVVWNDQVSTRIKAIRIYASFKVMLDHENPAGFYPGATRDVVLTALRGMYRNAPRGGVLVFELERITS